MARTEATTNWVGVLPTRDEADAVVAELVQAGIGTESITVVDDRESCQDALKHLGLGAGERAEVEQALGNGAVLVAVGGVSGEAEARVAAVLGHHQQDGPDPEADEPASPASAEPPASQETVPVVEETLRVGKRQVEAGGVRVVSRLVSRPVQRQVRLREEHVTVERRPVRRPISEAELAALADQSIEVTAMAEEPVVEKRAEVVEEVVVGKQAGERVEVVRDQVRRTEVRVERTGTGAVEAEGEPGEEETAAETPRTGPRRRP